MQRIFFEELLNYMPLNFEVINFIAEKRLLLLTLFVWWVSWSIMKKRAVGRPATQFHCYSPCCF